MELKHKLIFLSSIGFGIGVISGTLLTAFIGSMQANDGNLYLCSQELIEAVGSPLLAFLIQALASGIFGMFTIGGTVVYGMERLSLLKSTVIHYIIVTGGYYVLAFLMRWFSPKDIDMIVIMFLINTTGYFIIWLINYLSYKHQIEQINTELNELKSSKEEDK